MNLRQKYKREKKKNEELRRTLDYARANPNTIQLGPFDVKTLRAVLYFDPVSTLPPDSYIRKEIMIRLTSKIKEYVNVEYSQEENYPWRRSFTATVKVVDDRTF